MPNTLHSAGCAFFVQLTMTEDTFRAVGSYYWRRVPLPHQQLVKLGAAQQPAIDYNGIDRPRVRDVDERISTEQNEIGCVVGRDTAPGIR